MNRLIRTFLLVVFLVGLYGKHGFSIGGFYVPYPLCLSSGFLLLGLNTYRITKKGILYLLLFLLIVSYFTVLTLKTGYNDEKLNGLIQLFFVLFSSYGFFLEASHRDNRFFSFLAYVGLILIVLVCVLELLPVTSTFIQNLHREIYQSSIQQYYAKLTRDQIIGFGFKRPTGLSQETSHVAMFAFILSSVWYLTTTRKNKKLLFVILSMALTVLIRSPINIFNYVFIGIAIMNERRSLNVRNIVIGLLVVVGLLFITENILSYRFERIMSGTDNSAYTRVFRPFYFTYITVKQNPIFGAGILNNEYLLTLYYMKTGDSEFYSRITGNIYIINNIGAHFSYFGVVGGLLLLLLLIKMFDYFMIKNDIVFYGILALIAITIGSYAGQRMWGFIVLLLAVFRSIHIVFFAKY